jgi:hypothetical protein
MTIDDTDNVILGTNNTVWSYSASNSTLQLWKQKTKFLCLRNDCTDRGGTLIVTDELNSDYTNRFMLLKDALVDKTCQMYYVQSQSTHNDLVLSHQNVQTFEIASYNPQDHKNYWIWIVAIALVLIIILIVFIMLRKKKHQLLDTNFS